ncbi:MAG: hypothetical protein OXG30_08045, partial [bacterium]|nr:hypothetical protein [bacterium]
MWVVVGWASAIGLKWLGELSGHRQVHLLIGDTCQGFSKSSAECGATKTPENNTSRSPLDKGGVCQFFCVTGRDGFHLMW